MYACVQSLHTVRGTIAKYSYLVMIAATTSWLGYGMYNWFVYGSHINIFYLILSIDSGVNVACLVLGFRFAERWYESMCATCQISLEFCCYAIAPHVQFCCLAIPPGLCF